MPFIPHTDTDVREMLAAIGAPSIDALFEEIPAALRIKSLAGIPEALTEMEVGRALTKGGAAAVVESVKAASDVYSPVSGQVIANNSEALSATPELVNSDPYGQGWLFKVKPSNSGELSSLLDAQAYEKVVEEAGH